MVMMLTGRKGHLGIYYSQPKSVTLYDNHKRGVKTKFARHLLLNDRKIDGLLCSCHADLSDYAKDYRQAVSGVRMTTLEKKLQRNYHSLTHTSRQNEYSLN